MSEAILFADSEKSRSKRYHLDKSYLDNPRSFGAFRLFQIGRLYCTGTTKVDKHAHINWFELTIVTGGKGVVYTNDVGVPVCRGDIYLSYPGDFHAISSDASEPLKYDFFSFGVEDAQWMSDMEQIMQTHMSADRRIVRDEMLSALVGNAIVEINGSNLHSEQLISALFMQIQIRLIRGFLNDSSETPRTTVSEPEALCYQLMNYIDTHIYTMTGLEDLARASNYNYSYLSSLFRRVTSGTLSDYYRNRRLETGRLLIIENKLPVSQISELLHYSSICTFSRAFKERYGISPGQYRKNYLNLP